MELEGPGAPIPAATAGLQMFRSKVTVRALLTSGLIQGLGSLPEIHVGNLPMVTLWVIKPHPNSDSTKQVREKRYFLGSQWQRGVLLPGLAAKL